MTEFYLPASGAIYNESNLQANTGFPPTADPGFLAANGIYTIIPSDDPYDPNLYTTEPSFTIVGDYANESWVATALPLPTAKENATVEVKDQSNAEASALVASSGVNLDIWTGAASQDPGDRPPVYNTLLGTMATIGDTLAAKLTAIDSSTTVDEINNIVNPPSGIFNTGRGLAGSEDMNPSYFVELNSVSLTPIDMEIYVPGTMTVIPYDSFLPPPYTFDSLGDCFNPGDYVIQIRIAATSEVIAEFEVPLNEYNEDVSF
jgi:hypothetical protein